MSEFTSKSIYEKLGNNPSERQILVVAAMMMRNEKIIRNNIFTLKYYVDMTKMAYNAGKLCSCFN